MANNHLQTCSQCQGSPFHQHCERNHYKYDSKNINTIHKSGMSNPQTFMNKQQRQDKLSSCFPIRHLAKILKESSSFMSQIFGHVIIWEMAAETNKTKKQQQNNHHEQPHNQLQQQKHVHVQLAAYICTALLVLPGHNSQVLIRPGYNASLCTHSVAVKAHFSTGIKSLQWIGCVNLELCSYSRNCPFFKQNLYMDETPTTAKVTHRPSHSLRRGFSGHLLSYSRTSNHPSPRSTRKSDGIHPFRCAGLPALLGTTLM